jgi:UrcA family protein
MNHSDGPGIGADVCLASETCQQPVSYRPWFGTAACVIWLLANIHFVTQEMDMNSCRTALVLMLLSLSGTAVLASNVADAPLQKSVRFADLDLSRTDDTEKLHQRLHAAARQVCAPADGRSVAEKQRFRACTDDALARAVAQINRPPPTKVHAANSSSGAAMIRLVSIR